VLVIFVPVIFVSVMFVPVVFVVDFVVGRRLLPPAVAALLHGWVVFYDFGRFSESISHHLTPLNYIQIAQGAPKIPWRPVEMHMQNMVRLEAYGFSIRPNYLPKPIFPTIVFSKILVLVSNSAGWRIHMPLIGPYFACAFLQASMGFWELPGLSGYNLRGLNDD
jgi:hypothetical protein